MGQAPLYSASEAIPSPTGLGVRERLTVHGSYWARNAKRNDFFGSLSKTVDSKTGEGLSKKETGLELGVHQVSLARLLFTYDLRLPLNALCSKNARRGEPCQLEMKGWMTGHVKGPQVFFRRHTTHDDNEDTNGRSI